jgi:hypothetical protein
MQSIFRVGVAPHEIPHPKRFAFRPPRKEEVYAAADFAFSAMMQFRPAALAA